VAWREHGGAAAARRTRAHALSERVLCTAQHVRGPAALHHGPVRLVAAGAARACQRSAFRAARGCAALAHRSIVMYMRPPPEAMRASQPAAPSSVSTWKARAAAHERRSSAQPKSATDCPRGAGTRVARRARRSERRTASSRHGAVSAGARVRGRCGGGARGRAPSAARSCQRRRNRRARRGRPTGCARARA